MNDVIQIHPHREGGWTVTVLRVTEGNPSGAWKGHSVARAYCPTPASLIREIGTRLEFPDFHYFEGDKPNVRFDMESFQDGS